MTCWRILAAVVLLLTIALPLAMPFLDLLRHPAAWGAWQEADRLLLLGRNTGLLVAGTLALALPFGIAGAFLLYRTDLPLRRLLRFLTVLTLFVPLPLFASGWQAALGSGGWLPIAAWTTPPPGDPDVSPTGIAWKPWAQGIGTAVWIHAVAGLPWVVLLVGQGLRWVEPELEEDAFLTAGPARAFWHVTLRRSAAAIVAAALWVALQTATEITVTDMMQVRTFAEEVYNQFVRPEPGSPGQGTGDALARTLVVSLPALVLTGLLVLWAAHRWERNLPPLETFSISLRDYRLGRLRWPCLTGVLAVVVVLAGVPIASLVWKTGLSGSPPVWSAPTAGHYFLQVVRGNGLLVTESLMLALVSGILAAGLALAVCWLALGRRWVQAGVLALMVAAWVLPGPVIGIGIKETVKHLMDGEDRIAGLAAWFLPERLLEGRGFRPVRAGLYDGPSFLPVMWAYLVRFFPCAVAVLWPVVRLLPVELRDAARVDGARPRQWLGYIILPLFGLTAVVAALAVAVLSLGELSASKLTSTPGAPTLAHEIFGQMHFGVANNLAALCLLLLAMAALGGTLVALFGWLLTKAPAPHPQLPYKGGTL